MIARLQLKTGVTLHGNDYINAMLQAVQIAYGDHDIPLVVVTAGFDGVHGPDSYHYQHRAIDVRFWNVPEPDRAKVATSIRKYLPRYYDVVIEADHYHIEADLKKEGLVLSSPDPR